MVASRLSEDPDVSVLLLEAGGYPNLFLDVPLLAAEIQQTKFDWAYRTLPQEFACFGLKNRVSEKFVLFVLQNLCFQSAGS